MHELSLVYQIMFHALYYINQYWTCILLYTYTTCMFNIFFKTCKSGDTLYFVLLTCHFTSWLVYKLKITIPLIKCMLWKSPRHTDIHCICAVQFNTTPVVLTEDHVFTRTQHLNYGVIIYTKELKYTTWSISSKSATISTQLW